MTTTKKKRRQQLSKAARDGDGPGEYQVSSTVVVTIEALGDDEGRKPQDHFIVTTRREASGRWLTEVKHSPAVGEENRLRLPGRVLDTIERHRRTIIKSQRSDRSRDQANLRMAEGKVPAFLQK